MIRYVYFSPEGKYRSRILSDAEAARSVGERVLLGCEMHQRRVATPLPGKFPDTPLVYFQSDVSGKVWAFYYEL